MPGPTWCPTPACIALDECRCLAEREVEGDAHEFTAIVWVRVMRFHSHYYFLAGRHWMMKVLYPGRTMCLPATDPRLEYMVALGVFSVLLLPWDEDLTPTPA